MSNQLQSLMSELEQFGKANDSATTERSRRMLNITRDTGEFLAVLVRATVARGSCLTLAVMKWGFAPTNENPLFS